MAAAAAAATLCTAAGGRGGLRRAERGAAERRMQRCARPPPVSASPRSVRRRTAAAAAADAAAPRDEPGVEANVTCIEGMPRCCRLVVGAARIEAPRTIVWDILTDYARLAEHVPNLKENEILERDETHCRLRQIGEQDVALGFKFSAAVVVDVEEYPTGGALASVLNSNEFSKDKCLSWITEKTSAPLESDAPGALCLPPPKEILFSLVEGDFREFKGVWRMDDLGEQDGGGGSGGAGSDSAKESPHDQTLLRYILRVVPQRWLPVRLIEGRISRDVRSNLLAIQALAERRAMGAAPGS